MAFISNSLDLVRSVFNRGSLLPQQKEIFDGVWSGNGMTYGGFTGSALYAVSDSYQASTAIQHELMAKLRDYDLMLDYPEIGNAVRILTDEATQTHVIRQQAIWVEADDQQVQEICNTMLHKQVQIEDFLWNSMFELASMGNSYENPLVKEGEGVVKLLNLPVPTVRRIEDRYGKLYGFIQSPDGAFNNATTSDFFARLANRNSWQQQRDGLVAFEPWEIAHFRFRGSKRNSLYGESVVDASRWAWKRLTMMEDAMVLYKLTRSPQRFVFYVDMGDVPKNEHEAYLSKVRDTFKKRRAVNSDGDLIREFSQLSQNEDFFIAKTADRRGTEIDVLSGLDGQQVDDSEYFRSKLFSSLPVPKSYLGMDETIGRANLGQQDIRMARSVIRLQASYKQGVRHICDVHLAARNIDPDMVNYNVGMVIPSGALEIAHIEVQRAKVELAAQYQGMNFPEEYIWSEILGLPDDEIANIKKIREQNALGAPQPAAGGDGNAAQGTSEVDKILGGQESRQWRRMQKDSRNEILEGMEQGLKPVHRRLNEVKALLNDVRAANKNARVRK